jgi:hypothetical protein
MSFDPRQRQKREAKRNKKNHGFYGGADLVEKGICIEG